MIIHIFRLKEKITDFCVQCFEVMCVWDCCDCYIRLAEFLSFIVFDPFIDLFITLCIVVNTAFMALDHHDMDPNVNYTLTHGNYVSCCCCVYFTLNCTSSFLFHCQFFTATFAMEAAIKLMAMSPKYYFQEGWNIFDFVIVTLSLVELVLDNLSGFTVLRSFRLVSQTNTSPRAFYDP